MPIACALTALTPDERAKAAELRAQLRTLVQRTEEHDDGYALELRAQPDTLTVAGAWMSLEARCCPFLTFALTWRAGDEAPWLRLSGRAGTKRFLRDEMGALVGA